MPLIDLKHIRFVNKNYWIDYQGNIDFAVIAEFDRMIYFLINLVNKCESRRCKKFKLTDKRTFENI